MDLENQLEQLNEETNNAKNSLRLGQSLTSDAENVRLLLIHFYLSNCMI